jgi:ketosteroid isomerase-like protein
MPGTARPREVVERLIDGISHGDWQELHVLYAENAVIEYPFALPAPRRLEGRQAIRRYFEAVANLPLELRAHNVSLHESRDPEVVIIEYDYDGLATATGRSFQVSNIQVSTVRDGLIVRSRDYHNHVALADAIGQLGELVSAITSQSDTGG